MGLFLHQRIQALRAISSSLTINGESRKNWWKQCGPKATLFVQNRTLSGQKDKKRRNGLEMDFRMYEID